MFIAIWDVTLFSLAEFSVPVFQKNLLPPSSGWMMTEAAVSSTTKHFGQTQRCNIPKDTSP